MDDAPPVGLAYETLPPYTNTRAAARADLPDAGHEFPRVPSGPDQATGG